MAVKLDHVQNYEGAIEAYEDACRLLHQVLERSYGDEDKRKLDSIVSIFLSLSLSLLLHDGDSLITSRTN